MNDKMLKRLEALLKQGESAKTPQDTLTWSGRAFAFIEKSLGADAAREFGSLDSPNWYEAHGLRVGHVEGLLALAEASRTPPESSGAKSGPMANADVSAAEVVASKGRQVFVVHGHDNEAKESIARFLQKLKLDPIILHEQASGGRTVIEKFETYSHGVVFAVVLLTPDDVGAVASESTNLRRRARQNVIMELGYFIGKLGRTKVCALHKGEVELPSDYQGVIYIQMDEAGAWKTKLAQELVQSKLPIELTGLIEN